MPLTKWLHCKTALHSFCWVKFKIDKFTENLRQEMWNVLFKITFGLQILKALYCRLLSVSLVHFNADPASFLATSLHFWLHASIMACLYFCIFSAVYCALRTSNIFDTLASSRGGLRDLFDWNKIPSESSFLVNNLSRRCRAHFWGSLGGALTFRRLIPLCQISGLLTAVGVKVLFSWGFEPDGVYKRSEQT